jgi:branched-subunit amino acid ABC-type transport system permease component
VRAVVDNGTAAELAGINVSRVFLLVFALASAIGAIAGFLIVATQEQVTPMLGMWSTLKGMLAMMLGGLGSLPGAVIGGVALGLLEAHSQWYLGPQLRDFTAYLLLFVLLALRPPWMSTRSAS